MRSRYSAPIDPNDRFTQTIKGLAQRVAELERAAGIVRVPNQAGTYTPTLTNIAIGTGGSAALSGQYRYVNGILQLEINAVLGTSGASVTGEPTFSLPAGFTATLTGTNLTNGIDVLMQAGVTGAYGDVRTVSATAIALRVVGAGGTYAVPTTITSTVPGTWAAGNFIRIKTVIGGTFA